MEETPHLVTHMMAVGAEKRLEDYHFLRNTYETITSQEIQLNRILRMLDEDEFSLNWRVDLLPIGRARSRSAFEFDRSTSTLVLQGSLAYERLRDFEVDTSKSTKIPTLPTTPRRVQELRERRQRLSEQRELPSSSSGLGDRGASSSRLRALAEYDSELSESQTKRRQQADENRLNISKSEEKDLSERRREKFKTTFDDENQSYGRSKQSGDEESSTRSRKLARLNQDQDENVSRDQENDSNKSRKLSTDYDYNKPRTSLSRTTRFDEDQEDSSDKVRKPSFESSKRLSKDIDLSEDRDNDSTKIRKPSTDSSTGITRNTRVNEDKDENAGKNQENGFDQTRKSSIQSTKDSTKNARLEEEQNESEVNDQEGVSNGTRKSPTQSRKSSTKSSRLEEDQSEKALNEQEDDISEARQSSTQSRKSSTKSSRLEEDQSEKTLNEQEDDISEARQSSTQSRKSSTKSSRFGEDRDDNEMNEQEEDSSKTRKPSVDSSKRLTKTLDTNEDQESNSNKTRKPSGDSGESLTQSTRSDEDQEENISNARKESSDTVRKSSVGSSKASTKNDRLDEDEEENSLKSQKNESDKTRKPSVKDDKPADIELSSFTVRRKSPTNKNEDEEDSIIHLLCKWDLPKSSSTIDYFTIERQVGDEDWSAVGKKINKSENQTDLDISLSDDGDQSNTNAPSYFRLKAHLRNGQTFTSKATDGILLNLSEKKNIIVPDVKVLSPSSVQLTWEGNENEEDETDEKTNIYDIEKKEEEQPEWEKVTEVPLSQQSAKIDSLNDAEQCEFRLVPSTSESEETKKPESKVEPEKLTVHNVNELLSSLHVEPTSGTTVDINISEEGFKKFDSFKVEYTTADQPNKWKQVSDISHDDPHLTIDKLKQGTDYKFRFTPNLSGTKHDINSSQLSLVLDVKTPSTRQGRFTKDENETPVESSPPEFSIKKIDSTSVLIEAIVPEEEQPATFEDVYDVFSKKENLDDDDDDDWTKVGTIDKEHLSTTVEDLEENTAYAFKIDNTTSPSDDNESNTVEEFKFDTTPVKKFDPSQFLAKIEESLENVVNGVMQAAAGHQTLEEPVNKSLNEVIKELFRDDTLLQNEQHGFDTLALNNDLQLYRGPKQMMLNEIEIDETTNLSEHYGEIIIHNYPTSKQSVAVREENGNTRVTNIDGDIIIRNVTSDVSLKNEKAHHELSMNIVGQAFLKGVQGTLVASKFKGIIVVKNVHKP